MTDLKTAIEVGQKLAKNATAGAMSLHVWQEYAASTWPLLAAEIERLELNNLHLQSNLTIKESVIESLSARCNRLVARINNGIEALE